MTKTALSEEAMRRSLVDIRLPPTDLIDSLADLLLAAGLGGFAALVALGLLKSLTRQRSGRAEIPVRERIATLQALPEDARRVAFLHLLKEIAPDRYAELKQTLYLPEAACDPEAEVLARV